MVEERRLPIPSGGKKPNIKTNPLGLCMIEKDETVDPLSLITPLEGYSLSYRILKETDKTSDQLPLSMDSLVCDCWKRVQIERMKTACDEPYMVPQKFFQFCKWHLDEPKDPKAPFHFGKLPIRSLSLNRRWNVKITEMIWNNNDWKSNCRYRLLKCAGQYFLVKPIPEYPPTHRLPWGFYPKEIGLNKNL